MPAGLVRYQHCGAMHFLTFSCYGRLPNPGDAKARGLFESALERMRQRYKFAVAGYVVMPEHVHLLVTEPELAGLDVAVKSIKLSVALRSRERPFWQARYYDFNVWTEAKRVESCGICIATRSQAWAGGEAGRLALVELPALRDRA